ncbi:hypothetical protein TeGR_g14006, partial [Tetraparma gracilis]
PPSPPPGSESPPAYDPFKLFCGGVDPTLHSRASLLSYFSSFGRVDFVHVRQGCAFVTMGSEGAVERACGRRWPVIAGAAVEVKRAKRSARARTGAFGGRELELLLTGLGEGETEERVRAHFGERGVDAAEVAVFGGEGGEGAIMCRSAEDAARAVEGAHEIGGRGVGVRRLEQGEVAWSKLFVGGLDGGVESPDIREFFGKFGTIKDACVMFNKNLQRSRGFGFVTFASFVEARRALQDQPIRIRGREVEIKYSKPKVPAQQLGERLLVEQPQPLPGYNP